MGRKLKYTVKQKIRACEDYLNGKFSATEIARQLNMGKRGNAKVREWSKVYEKLGSTGFSDKPYNKAYSKELKEQIVHEYLENCISLVDLSIKYKIPSHTTVQKWIIMYTKGKELINYDPKPEVYVMQRKKTTLKERKEIVQHCLENGKNYKDTALLYKVSYSQIHYWVKKYIKDGEDGLLDNRGIPKSTDELSEQEKQNQKILELERENLELTRELELLKKLKELGRRR